MNLPEIDVSSDEPNAARSLGVSHSHIFVCLLLHAVFQVLFLHSFGAHLLDVVRSRQIRLTVPFQLGILFLSFLVFEKNHSKVVHR